MINIKSDMSSLKEISQRKLLDAIKESPPIIKELITEESMKIFQEQCRKETLVSIKNDIEYNLPYIINDIILFRQQNNNVAVSPSYYINKYSRVDPALVLSAITTVDLLNLSTNHQYINNGDVDMYDNNGSSSEEEIDYGEDSDIDYDNRRSP
jgi:hypothetical protein